MLSQAKDMSIGRQSTIFKQQLQRLLKSETKDLIQWRN